jgi:hypothetical protein
LEVRRQQVEEANEYSIGVDTIGILGQSTVDRDIIK